MDQEIKTKWVAALRSGAYAQGREYLRTAEGFCCLGVLCDIVDSAGWSSGLDFFSYVGTGNDWADTLLPVSVIEAAQLGAESPEISITQAEINSMDLDIPIILSNRLSGHQNKVELAELNDAGATFAQIADLIEERL